MSLGVITVRQSQRVMTPTTCDPRPVGMTTGIATRRGAEAVGADDDLNKATDIARNMVTRFGMHATLGPVTWETARPTFLGEDALPHYTEREFSEATAREIDCAVRDLFEAGFETALAVLRTFRPQLEEGATRLLAKETLTRDELPVLDTAMPVSVDGPGVSVRG